MQAYQRDFLQLALDLGALRFGRFTLKSGRISPYFFNAGRFCTGDSLRRLGLCYAGALQASGLRYDMLFGPAYKGIPLVCATAMALSECQGRDVAWSFNRKEAKDHGEGGTLVGAPLSGHVVIVDDVITAGTAVRESLAILAQSGAIPAGVLISLDRRERGLGDRSAMEELEDSLGIPPVSIATLDHLLEFLVERRRDAQYVDAIRSYRDRYGA